MKRLLQRVSLALTLSLLLARSVEANDVGGVIRSGPTISQTQPHWMLGITFDYAFKSAAVGFGVDMMVSVKPYTVQGAEDLKLTSIGFFTEFRYHVLREEDWKCSAGSTVGARSVTYQNASNNSFNPTDWVPSVPDNPIGSTMHFVLGPFVQYERAIFSRLHVIGRLGYDLHIGPDYIDLTAASLSGPTVQLGIRVPIS